MPMYADRCVVIDDTSDPRGLQRVLEINGTKYDSLDLGRVILSKDTFENGRRGRTVTLKTKVEVNSKDAA